MKKRKLLVPLILLGGLVLVVAAVLIISNMEKKKEDIKVSGETIFTLNEANALTISWDSEENDFAFHRGADGKWVYDKDEEFPVNQDEVEDAFDLFRNLTAAFVIENVTDFAQYGLTDPVSTVTVTTTERQEDLVSKEVSPRGEKSAEGEAHTIQILIGAFSVMDQKRYISIGDGNVYLLNKDPYETLNVPESYMIKNDRVAYFSNIDTTTVTNGGQTWTIKYDPNSRREFSYARNDSYYLELNGKKLTLDPDVTLQYFTDIVNILLENYVNYKVRDSELASYGLDDPEYVVTLNTVTKNDDGTITPGQFTLRFSRSPELRALDGKEPAEGEEQPEFKAYLRKDDSTIIYELSETQYNKLAAVGYNDLRHKKLMPADFGDIESIDFTVDGETYTITSVLADDVRTHYYDGKPLNISNLKNAVTAFAAQEFTDEGIDGQEELQMVFHLSSENFPSVTLTCIRKDANQSLVLVDGEPQALVLRTRMNSLREALIKISLGNDVSETTTAAAD